MSNTWAIKDDKYTKEVSWPEDAKRTLKVLGWYEEEVKRWKE